PYFRAKDYSINNRLIRADMSKSLAEHLRRFPKQQHFKYIVSPYDKYVTFLYDRENGFDSPDLVAWLDSSEKVVEAIHMIMQSKTPADVLIDPAITYVDTRIGIKESHAVLGALDMGSKLNIKGRLRAAEVGRALLKGCRRVDDLKGEDWIHLRCGGQR
ncbi:MAG: hypothetical protein WCC36_15080, partial [Gammaproteobacteria bacterium]